MQIGELCYQVSGAIVREYKCVSIHNTGDFLPNILMSGVTSEKVVYNLEHTTSGSLTGRYNHVNGVFIDDKQVAIDEAEQHLLELAEEVHSKTKHYEEACNALFEFKARG